MTFEKTVVVSLALLFLAGSPAESQTTWSAVPDFTVAANPNGAWSYGWEGFLGGPFHAYTVADTTSVPGIDAWLEAGFYPFDPPYVARNVTTKPICYEMFCVPVMYLHLHPSASDQYSVVRWTAPAAGLYVLGGAFLGLDYGGPTTTDVHVLVNSSVSLFDGEIDSFNKPVPFQGTAVLNAGDTIDFAVGYGSDGNYFNDSTGIRCWIALR